MNDFDYSNLFLFRKRKSNIYIRILFADDPASDMSLSESNGNNTSQIDLRRNESFPNQIRIPNQGSQIQLTAQNTARLHAVEPQMNGDSRSNDGNNNKTSSKCGLCPSAFASVAALNDHLRNHHKLASGRVLPCQHCDAQFLTIEELVQHQEQQHVGMETKGDLICAVCNSAFKNLAAYYGHIKTHANLYPYSTPDSDAIVLDDGQVDQAELNLNGEEESDLTGFFGEEDETRVWNFTCDACGGKFMRQEVYEYHLLLHRGERPYSCRECAKAFKSRPVLMLHEMCHNGRADSAPSSSSAGILEQGYSKAVFGRAGSNTHIMAATSALMESMASNGLTYQCTICDQIYDNKTALREHEIMHSVGGEYTCKVCGKKFRSLIGLKIHNNKHQNDLIQQQLNGSKTKETSGGLNGEVNGANLLYYEEVDGLDKERPFVCRVCDKRFKTKHALPYHMLLHTGETPFVCDFCGKGFRALISLKLHAKKHEDRGWNPSFDHMELVQRKYQQQVLLMGETRSVTKGKPPTIVDVIPFAKAVAMAPQQLNMSSSMGRGQLVMNGDDREEEMYSNGCMVSPRDGEGLLNRSGGSGEGSSSGGCGGGSGPAGGGEEPDEPNIHDFCAVEMMMEPEIEINEFEQNNKVPRNQEDGESSASRNGLVGEGDDVDMVNGGFHNGSQYAHLLPDDEENESGARMMKNESKSEDEYQMEDDQEEQNCDEDPLNDGGHFLANGHGGVGEEVGRLGPSVKQSQRPKFDTEELLQRAMQPQPMAINSILKYECPICFKRFKNRLSLPYHLMTHERGDPVNCNYCNRKFVSKMKLRRHLRIKHDVVDPTLGDDDENEEPKAPVSRFGKFKFACPTCNRKFKSKFTLKLHMKHHHLVRGRPGRPPKNPIVADQMRAMVEGMHSMPRISKVESIPAFFDGGPASSMLQSLMANNQLAVATPTAADEVVAVGEAQFDCDHCDQKFVTFAEYKLHMKYHLEQIATAAVHSSNMQATVKPKARYDMQNSYRLSKEYEHLRTKDGKYQCNICHKLFKCRQSLPYHMNLHKKNSIFRCLSCKTGFRNLHGFKMHNRIYHQEKEAQSIDPQLSLILRRHMGAAAEASPSTAAKSGEDVVQIKQELNESVELEHEDDQGEVSSNYNSDRGMAIGIGGGEEENSMASSTYKMENKQVHQNPRLNSIEELGQNHSSDANGEGSIKQESLDMDLSMALNQSLTDEVMNIPPLNLFQPPSLLHLQQLQQLQMQMHQQSGATSAAADEESSPQVRGIEPEMRPIELESGERGYLCMLCNKVCRSKQASIYHRMIHTGEKPYKCHICDKRCRSQANLELHKKMHVNELRAEGGAGGVRRRKRQHSSGGAEMGPIGGSLPIDGGMEEGSMSGLGMLSMMMGGAMTGVGDSSMDHTMTRWRAFADMKRLRCMQCNYKFKRSVGMNLICDHQ